MNNDKNKSIVEETLIQLKAVEDAINENAKGILASTMKQEISDLVKESLKGSKKTKTSMEEQDEPEGEVGVPPMDDEEVVDDEVEGQPDDVEGVEVDAETEMGVAPTDNEESMPPLDMTQSPMSDVMKVFRAMGDEDGIIVKKDTEGNIHLSDTTKGSDYFIQMGGMENTEMPMRAETNEGVLYELEFRDDESYMDDEFYPKDNSDFEELEFEDEEDFMPRKRMGRMSHMDEGEGEESYNMEGEGEESVMYEVEFETDEAELDFDFESGLQSEEDEYVKESFKAKGRIGKPLKKSIYPSKLKRGVTEMGDFENESEWNEIDDMDGEFVAEEDDEVETKEAARTYGKGSKEGRGLRKGITPNRNLVYGKNGVQSESVKREMNLLREKNEEYKKALDFFRNKLNEVAVFNSNLAYSTRLFTEHTTTKQEKINILRRFDNVESLKESKSLYRTIKSELDNTNSDKAVFTESVQARVTKTPQTGSATNLIESKTYENPQFLRMKDLMNKIK
jgi:hypothetical protein